MVARFELLSTLNIKKACAASLRSDRFGSDATNDKQLSLASRVSHSGLDPESHRTFRDDPTLRYIEGILNRVQDDGKQDTSAPRRSQSSIATTGDGYRSGMINHEIVRIRGTRPTLSYSPHRTHSTHHIHHTHSDGQRSGTFNHGFVGFGRIRPTLRKAYRGSSFLIPHSSLYGALASASYQNHSLHRNLPGRFL